MTWAARFIYPHLLFRMDCFNGANICAGSAIGTCFRVYLIDITFGNCFNRAFIDAGSTSCAIFINLVSHDLLNLCL